MPLQSQLSAQNSDTASYYILLLCVKQSHVCLFVYLVLTITKTTSLFQASMRFNKKNSNGHQEESICNVQRFVETITNTLTPGKINETGQITVLLTLKSRTWHVRYGLCPLCPRVTSVQHNHLYLVSVFQFYYCEARHIFKIFSMVSIKNTNSNLTFLNHKAIWNFL